MAAVHRYEGTVNQVMGDGIMALFGAPIAHEDHAIRAGYAALALGLGTLYATGGQRAQARTALTAALDLYRDMGMTFWLPQAEAGLAQVS